MLKQNLINSDHFCISYFLKNVNENIEQNLQIFYPTI